MIYIPMKQTGDILVDDPTLYSLELGFVRYFGWFMRLVFVLFIVGIVQQRPVFLLKMLFVVKCILAAFLIYRFHPYRRGPYPYDKSPGYDTKTSAKLPSQFSVTFTQLDQKVVYSSAIYILLLSFSDVIVYYMDWIRGWIRKMYTMGYNTV